MYLNSLLQHRASGISLPLALFVLVVVSLLALGIFRMTALQQHSVVQEVLTTRALLAAESGAQAQMMRIFPLTGSGLCAAQSITFSVSGLDHCVTNSSCTSKSVDGTAYYFVESSGRCSVDQFSALRIIQVQARNG